VSFGPRTNLGELAMTTYTSTIVSGYGFIVSGANSAYYTTAYAGGYQFVESGGFA
jgi:hypothetical protein